jgi:hypothetical protein
MIHVLAFSPIREKSVPPSKMSHTFVIPSEARNLSYFAGAHTEERFLASLGMTKIKNKKQKTENNFSIGNLLVIPA